jgi:hypothetical protein
MPFLLAMSNFVSWIQVINVTFERELITGIMRVLVLGLFIARRMHALVCNTDYTFNLVQFRPSLIVLVSSRIGINHCKFIKQLWAI